MSPSSHPPFSRPRSGGSPSTAGKQFDLHPLERTLAGLAIALLVVLPWLLGGMRLPGQYTALALSTLAFIVALLPRHYTERHHTGGNATLYPYPRLLRFPLFWLGLVYFAVILCQIFNPAYSFRSSQLGWWTVKIAHIEWLPHGVEGTPLKMMSGWRTLMIQGGAWLLVCALWVGITRRKTAKLILTAVALNGVLVAAVVIMQRLTGTKKMLWLWDPPAGYFAAGFIYKNHAGEFLCLIVALCLGFAWWHMRQAEKELKKSHPGMVWVLCAVLVLIGQMFTYARAASGVGLVFFTLVALAYVLRLAFRSRGNTPPLVTGVTALLGVAFVTVAITQMDTDRVWNRFEKLKLFDEENTSTSVSSRRLARQATLDMAEDSLWLGHGAGSFRFIFPRYQQNYPEIFVVHRWNRKSQTMVPTKKRMLWEYAHNDYAQLLAELGVVGVALAVLAVACVLIAAWQVTLATQFGLLLMVGGPALVAATAAVDFPFHNPAVLFTTLAVLALTLRWAQVARR